MTAGSPTEPDARTRLAAAAGRSSSADLILAMAERHLWRYYAQDLTLADVAAAIPVSPYYLAHLFQRERGTTYLRYLTSVRLHRARALLMSGDLPVSVIGDRVGFRSAKRFRIRYKQAYGLSPSAYRSIHRATARST